VNRDHNVTILPGEARVEVCLAGELLAETDHPVILEETGLPDRYYVPRHDVQMQRLRLASFHTTCPLKGEASYWSVDIDGETHDGVAWSYETPIPAAAGIRGLLSFYPDRVEVRVDGRPLRA
jgi:uncharacterized protein (DUF427 family)